jgi:hypothetical protein
MTTILVAAGRRVARMRTRQWTGVAATSAASAWAIDQGTSRSRILRWNGTAWK